MPTDNQIIEAAYHASQAPNYEVSATPYLWILPTAMIVTISIGVIVVVALITKIAMRRFEARKALRTPP